MKIFLVGKNGQLGSCFRDALKGSSHSIFAFDASELDITDQVKVAEMIQSVQPDIIVNAAAYTAVDKAETEVDLAYAVNAKGPQYIAEQAAALHIPLIHVSTDYVFAGNGIEPYKTIDSTAPQGVYGASKLAGEQIVQQLCPQHIILRTSWVFSEYGHNFVKTMVRLAKERDSLSVVADQYGCPTYAGDLAQAIKSLCDHYEVTQDLSWGIYHYCGDQPTSWHGFARAIFVIAKEQGVIARFPELTAVSTEQYPTPATRPAYSVMDCSELRILKIQPSNWLTALRNIIGMSKG